jgi:hypothetical protein
MDSIESPKKETTMNQQNNELKEMLHNPACVGLGGFPRMISDEEFAAAMSTNVVEDGASDTLKLMRKVLENTFEHAFACTSDSDWVVRSMREISAIGSRQFFLNFLKTLRAELGE